MYAHSCVCQCAFIYDLNWKLCCACTSDQKHILYIYVYVCTFMCIYAKSYVYANSFVYIRVPVYVCESIHVYVYENSCVYIRVPVYVCEFIHVYACEYLRIYVHACACICKFMCMDVHSCVYVRIPLYVFEFMHTSMQIYFLAFAKHLFLRFLRKENCCQQKAYTHICAG